MHILIKKIIFILLSYSILSGCKVSTPEYDQINGLPKSEWDNYAKSLPVVKRIDLHLEIMRNSSHNPLYTITESFQDDPQETYEEIVRRLKSGDDNRYYVGVLFSIDRNDSFDICDQKDRRVVQKYLSKYKTDAVKSKTRQGFYYC